MSQQYQVTYHKSSRDINIRCCVNLGCPVVLYDTVTGICPDCGERSSWKVTNLQYVREEN